LRNVQPSRKCTTPAAEKAISGHAPASSSTERSSVATATASRATAAMTRLMKVETYGSSMSTSARRLRLWKSPNPMPEATAQRAAVTRASWS
jgi:hypothetical protein